MKLTPDRLAVLKAIQRFLNETGFAPNHRHIAVKCGKEPYAADWARAKIKALLDTGLIYVSGRKFGARTYQLTETGRAALAEAERDE